MAVNGLALNLAGAIIITLMTYWLGSVVFGIEINIFPEWAKVE
jgi:hypothetical protein